MECTWKQKMTKKYFTRHFTLDGITANLDKGNWRGWIYFLTLLCSERGICTCKSETSHSVILQRIRNIKIKDKIFLLVQSGSVQRIYYIFGTCSKYRVLLEGRIQLGLSKLEQVLIWDLEGYGAVSRLRHQWKFCVWKSSNDTDTDVHSGVTAERLENQEKTVSAEKVFAWFSRLTLKLVVIQTVTIWTCGSKFSLRSAFCVQMFMVWFLIQYFMKSLMWVLESSSWICKQVFSITFLKCIAQH